LLTHLLEMIARGVRSFQGLEEAVGVDQRTVRYYLQAGIWLGFLVDADEPLLSPDGLGYVYGGPARSDLYADAIERQPFVQRLLQRTGGRAPSTDQLARAIQRAAPKLAPNTVQRRTSAVRSLIAPFLDRRANETRIGPAQLSLPLSQAPALQPRPPLSMVAGRSFSPDVYRYLLCFLLDHGELTLGHVRGLLDRAGAAEVPLGGYVDLALGRGDATRVAERLIATPGAIARRELAASTASIILSDAGWRDHMEKLREHARTASGSVRTGGRYRRWNERLFGHAVAASTLEDDLARVLRDRSLSSWPRTSAQAQEPVQRISGAFLDVWQERGLLIALPPSLAQLWEGVSGVNRRLRNARHRTDAVGVPTTAYLPVVTHGGLLHPGESLPRVVPDTRSLRQRLVSTAPYVTMMVALLLGHRTRNASPELVFQKGEWHVKRQRRDMGPLLDVLDGFAGEQGWLTARRPRGGVTDGVLVSLLERLGVLVCVSDRAMLDDGFFHQLRHEEEEQQLHASLSPLSASLTAYLQRLFDVAREER
jgi:hypothetical protein